MGNLLQLAKIGSGAGKSASLPKQQFSQHLAIRFSLFAFLFARFRKLSQRRPSHNSARPFPCKFAKESLQAGHTVLSVSEVKGGFVQAPGEVPPSHSTVSQIDLPESQQDVILPGASCNLFVPLVESKSERYETRERIASIGIQESQKHSLYLCPVMPDCNSDSGPDLAIALLARTRTTSYSLRKIETRNFHLPIEGFAESSFPGCDSDHAKKLPAREFGNRKSTRLPDAESTLAPRKPQAGIKPDSERHAAAVKHRPRRRGPLRAATGIRTLEIRVSARKEDQLLFRPLLRIRRERPGTLGTCRLPEPPQIGEVLLARSLRGKHPVEFLQFHDTSSSVPSGVRCKP